MIELATNEFFISESVNELSDITDFLDVGTSGSDYDCNIKDELHSIEYLSNIVKNSGTAFVLQSFNSSDAMHYIPHFPDDLIDKINTAHKEKLNKIFNIYQLYDHVINNPDDVANGSASINVYNFINQSPTTLTSTNLAETIYPDNSFSHYDYIIGSNATSIKDKLTPNLLYTCRGIYLVLLYKNIADVYISYYNLCDTRMTAIDGTSRYCSSSAITNINTLINNFLLSSIDKIILFTTYKLKVTYNSNTLTLDDPGATSSTFFDTLTEDKHVIYNIDTDKYIDIVNNITKSGNSYTLTEGDIEGDISNNFTNGNKCIILPKKSDYASYTYDGAISKLSSANEIFNKNKSEYQKSIGNYNAIQGSFNNIDYIYYLTIVIVIISLIAIMATNSEQSRKTRVFIILIIVLLTYGMIFSFIEVAKRFTENFSATSATTAEISKNTGILNNNFKRYLEMIYMESSNYGMTRLYDTLTDASNKERRNVENNNKVLESSINRNDATTNAEWHRLFQRTLYIHTTFLFLILVLTYLWLSTIMPDMNIYLLFITIIASMILIFYYFRNLHRVVRTEYKHRYWTKMSV